MCCSPSARTDSAAPATKPERVESTRGADVVPEPAPRALPSAASAAWVSVVAGLFVLGLKWVAYLLTGSIALYSDALESIVNVAAALAMFWALRIAARPPDAGHPYGHTKAEYFSAVLEGALILAAALAIFREVVPRIVHPVPLQSLGVGIAVSVGASAVNAGVASYLVRCGKRLRSPALRADGLHLWTDVATSIGVLAGTALAGVTGAWILDPLLALAVAVNILRIGMKLVRESVGGLMDEAVSPKEIERLWTILRGAMDGAIQAHDLKTRHAGTRTFIEFHLVVPAAMTVATSHALCDRLEAAIETAFGGAQVTIHVEPEEKAEESGVAPG